jgi:hypothetical protein
MWIPVHVVVFVEKKRTGLEHDGQHANAKELHNLGWGARGSPRGQRAHGSSAVTARVHAGAPHMELRRRYLISLDGKSDEINLAGGERQN